jgi:hypothetical protein
MSGINQKFWHETIPVTVLDKLRNTLTLPAFCVRCGIDNGSVFCNTRTATPAMAFEGYAGANQYLNLAFTFECWFKTSSFFKNRFGILIANKDNGGGIISALGMQDGKFKVQILDASAILHEMVSSVYYNTNKWTHVAVAFDGNTIRLFQDGVMDTFTLSISAPTLPGASETAIGGSGTSSKFNGHIAEVRMWNIAMSESQIQYNKNRRKGKNLNLMRYYRLNEHDTAMFDYVNPSIPGNTFPFQSFTFSSYEQDSEDFPPLILGGSFVAAKCLVSGLDTKVSLKYPVKKPSGANFMLCVAWLENEDDLLMQRRRLWDIDGVSIYPEKPVRYRGEVLPENFRFEIWNVDGNENVQLQEDLVIKLSHVTLPQNQRDTTEINRETLDVDYTTFSLFRMLFPIQFIENAWGTCENPRQPDRNLMSDNLILWGGISPDSTSDTGDHLILEGGEGNILDEGGDSLKPEA